ncbi:Gag-Pro-Pol polyprotein [Labeo rohita]|uniref:ribonuclease H n=1 Tax=Labeo rohita TaxID=84645 RepID=A0ABQ8L775_LABRO|nr:Gag-Pro-Pol polyprotein [Labeo rohita]
MPTCLGHVEETLVLVSGPGAGSSLLPRNASDGRVPHRLGSGHEWPPRPRSVERSPSSLALQLPDDAGRVSGSLRAGPSGEGRGPPHPSVPVSPQCPQEISLPTLPVLQGAAVSSEPTPQSSARKRSGAGELATPVGVSTAASSAVSCRSSVTGLAAQTTPEASLERLAPLVDYWLLPNVSAWVLRTVERGYRGAPPLPFNGVFPTVVGPEQGLVMEQEVETLLRKEAIEVVPPHDRESGFYSRYVIVLKKDGGLRPILDLRQLNRSVMRLKFRMLTVKFLRFAFRGEAYQYRVFPFGLALSPRTFTKCVDAALAPLRLRGIRILNYIDNWLILAQSEHKAVQHRDVVLAHMKELGLRLNAKKKDHLSRRGVGFDHDAGMFVTCSDRVDLHCSQESERRPVTHCEAVPATAGSDGSSVQRVTFWPAVHETPTVVAQDQGVLPEGKPTSHDQGHAALPTCLGHVEEALVFVSGPGAGSSLSPRNASDGRIPHRLGSGHEWPPCPRSVERSPTHVAHNCLEMLAVFLALKHFLPDLRDRHVLVRTDNTSVVSYINHQGGLCSRPLYKLAHQILVWSQGKLLSLKAVYLPGYLNLGADILSRQGPRPRDWMLHPKCHLSPPPGAVETLGVASEGAHLLASGLSTEVVETILQSRAPSTRKLYALKWKIFTSWCGRHQQDPVNCPVGTVLEFLQDRLSAGLSHSTLKVYVAAIAAYHAPLGGLSVGKVPLVSRFLRGALRRRPPVRSRVPSWDLSVVLEALCWPPFEPIEEISFVILRLKRLFDRYYFLKESWGSSGPLSGPFFSGLCARFGKSLFAPSSPLLSTTASRTTGLLSSSLSGARPAEAKLYVSSSSGSRLTQPGVFLPPRPFLKVSLFRTSVMLRDGPRPSLLSGFMTWTCESLLALPSFVLALPRQGLGFWRRNETPRLEALILHPCERCFSPEADAGFQRTCIYSFLVDGNCFGRMIIVAKNDDPDSALNHRWGSEFLWQRGTPGAVNCVGSEFKEVVQSLPSPADS